jgi:hypothetical protein
MKSLRLRRPSPALIISIIALVMAMGGTGYAALKLPKNSVGAKQLRNNSVTGAKVKNHSLTGSDVKLSSLGTVPSATNATNATNATTAANASALQGHPASDFATGPGNQKIDFRAADNTGPTQIFNGGGLTLTAACSNTGTLTLNATTSVDHAEIQSYGDGSDTKDDDFQVSETHDIAGTAAENEERDIVYTTPSGPVVALQILDASAAHTAPFGGTASNCLVAGFGVVG